MGTQKFHSKEIQSDEIEQKAASAAGIGEVNKVYDELKVIEKPMVESLVSRPLAALVVGLLSGIVGAFMVLGDAFGITSLLVDSQSGTNGRTIILEKRERIDVPWEESKEKIFEEISKSVHGVYRVKSIPEGEDVVGGVYFHEEQVGVALSATTDGWLVTSGAAVKEKGEYGIAVAGRVLPVEKTILDPFTGLAFLKLPVQNLQPVRFSGKDPDMGTIGIVGSSALNEFRGEIVALTEAFSRSISGKNPYESSERNTTYAQFGFSGNLLPGAGAFNASGDLYGVFDGQNGFVSSSRITKVLPEVLKEGKVSTTVLGVTTLDVGYLAVDRRLSALPFQGARIQSILTNSPAQAAKLQVGDIILRVEKELVDGRTPLANLIQEYPPGTKVNFEILRNTDTVNIAVTLGKQ